MGASVQSEGKAGGEKGREDPKALGVYPLEGRGLREWAGPERGRSAEEAARVRQVAPPCVGEGAASVRARGPELKK